MSKVLIISDTHGLRKELTTIKERHQLEHMIHCGDSELSYDAPELEGFFVVKGNCDIDNRFEEDLLLEIDGLKLFVTHGHLYNVKSNLLKLAYKAQEEEAHIVCYGHSHVIHAEQTGNQLLVNPGSIRYPRGYSEKTYVIIEWESLDNVKVNFYNLAGSIISELSYEASFE